MLAITSTVGVVYTRKQLQLIFCLRLEPRWDKDAHEFNPSRWLDGTVSAGDAVGPYANLWVLARQGLLSHPLTLPSSV
jgi:hypothetical protein